MKNESNMKPTAEQGKIVCSPAGQKAIRERLDALREQMNEEKIDAYYIPTDDFHLSEYVGDHFKCREYMSGFTGSAGTLVVLKNSAGLWVDSRYYIQARKQLEGTGIQMYRLGEEGEPSVIRYLKDNLKPSMILGMDGRCVPASQGSSMREELSKNGIAVNADMDLVGRIWKERPALSASDVWILNEEYSGKSAEDKLANVRKCMEDAGTDIHILASLDDIAWLLNIRADDIAYNPVMLAYAVIKKNEAILFADDSRISREVREYIGKIGFAMSSYNDVYDYCRGIAGEKVLVSRKRINYALDEALRAGDNTIIDRENPTTLAKAVKNETEIANIRRVHIKDGVAVARFMHWLKSSVADGNLNEITAADHQDRLRYETEGNLGLSFPTICAYAEHGAIVHYTATEDTCIPLAPKGLLLVDSGGHYLEGTTDITRTFALGEVSPEEKRDFTLVLKGMLNVAYAVFLKGTTGAHLDILAKAPMWEYGMSFGHGTGHGVGYLLNVHEGPNNISPVVRADRIPAAIVPGMVTTDEPGLYIEGSHGIRTENELLCVKGEKNAFGQFYRFEILTLAPIDIDAIDMSLMEKKDIERLNEYHARVYRELSPYMNEEERVWLKEYTRAI